jgi:hypothetical protein
VSERWDGTWVIYPKAHTVADTWITVLALAIDPFTQQIIHPIVCHRTLHDSVAYVPRANNLTGIGRYVGGDMPRSSELDASAAIYIGLLKDPGQFRCSALQATVHSTVMLIQKYPIRPLVLNRPALTFGRGQAKQQRIWRAKMVYSCV